MKENKIYLTKYAMYYGALLGIYWTVNLALGVIVIQLPSWAAIIAGFSNIMTIGVVFLTYWFTVQYRKKALNNSLGIFHGWQFGVMLFFYAALVSAIPQYIYLEFLAPDNLISQIYQQSAQVMKSIGTDPEVLKKAVEQMPTSPASMTIQNIFNCVFLGVLVSIPVALFAKRKPKKDANLVDVSN
ncbi:MAG: DUF4199 domain-containing protein [Dysgonamonadaceae bacterium]|jgi:hypothetical protein|nr:DUF4199 domain-containing protein [Dysgonamonadaceae bacterium]